MSGADQPSGEPEWISSHLAVKMLKKAGYNDPTTLAIWASRAKLRARAATAERDGEDDSLREVPEDFWLWVIRHGQAFWDAGTFAATVEMDDEHHRKWIEHWKFHEVSFHLDDLGKQFAVASPGDTESDAEPGPAAEQSLRAKLPPTAKQQHRKREDAAHAAAELVRAEKVNLATAIRRVAVHDPTIEDASLHRAIRNTFDQMYLSDGMPIEKN